MDMNLVSLIRKGDDLPVIRSRISHVDINARNDKGETYLHLVAFKLNEYGANLKIARTLVETGIDTQIMASNGETAYTYAMKSEQFHVGEILHRTISNLQPNQEA